MAADFRERTLQLWTGDILLTEQDGSDAYLDLVIAHVTTQVELDLDDDFEPPSPDNDETLELDGDGGARLDVPRRVRSLTSVSTRDSEGVLTLEAATDYRLRSSLNSTGTAMYEGRKLDWIDIIPGQLLSTGPWPNGPQTVRLIGKFGWSVVPTDIKRLVALRVYGLVKAKSDPLTTIVQRTTADAVITYGESEEERRIVARYTRSLPVLFG